MTYNNYVEFERNLSYVVTIKGNSFGDQILTLHHNPTNKDLKTVSFCEGNWEDFTEENMERIFGHLVETDNSSKEIFGH